VEQSYQRRILVRREPGAIAVDLEDNFHRFGVRLEVSGRWVTAATGVAGRTPWTTCPGALAALSDFSGHDVRETFSLDGASRAARHCTHLYDIAMLALDHLRLDLPGRDYRIHVAGSYAAERASLDVDGREVLAWEIADDRIVTPEAWRGVPVAQVHTRVHAAGDPVAYLGIMLLRRAVRISHGRFIDQDAWATAADVHAAPSCLSFQPVVRETAARVLGSARDFTGTEDELLADLAP
jgi:hypothetical protein